MAVPATKKPAAAPVKAALAKPAAPVQKKPAPKPAAPTPEPEVEEEIDLSGLDVEVSESAEDVLTEGDVVEEAAVEMTEEEIAAYEEPVVEEEPAPPPPVKKAPAVAKAAPAKPVATVIPPKPKAPITVAEKAKAVVVKPKPAPPVEEPAVEDEDIPIEAVGWEEEVATGGNFLPRFRGKKGSRDRGRMMPWKHPITGAVHKGPIKIRVHYNKKLRRFCNCNQKPNCPACLDVKGGWGPESADDKWVVPWLWIYRAEGESKEVKNVLTNWTFGGDKYKTVRDGLWPEVKEAGKAMTDVEIVVGCSNTDKQVLTMTLQSKAAWTAACTEAYKEGIVKFTEWLKSEFKVASILRDMMRVGKGAAAGDPDEDPFAEEDGPKGKSKAATGDSDADAALDDLVAGL